jgi:6-pyruvoyl-tetrahydropterin synthase
MSGKKEYFSINLKNSSFRFNAAHFLLEPLESLHGHNYRATLKIKGE